MGGARKSPPSTELKTFSDRLQKVITLKKVDAKVLAKKLQCSPSDMQKILAGMREPSMKKLIVIAGALGCSVDYLLGLSDGLGSDSNDVISQKPQIAKNSAVSEPFFQIFPKLLDSDIELLTNMAQFIVDRRAKKMKKVRAALARSKCKKAIADVVYENDEESYDKFYDEESYEDGFDDTEFDSFTD
jgi:DNA-binding helix-turn-helix protein